MKEERAVLCSRSKVRDFYKYLSYYPHSPLSVDLLVDLFLYPQLIINTTACGNIFYPTDIERGQWRNAFEDLINIGAIEVVRQYLSLEDERRIAVSGGYGAFEEDLAILAIFSQQRNAPFVFRQQEVVLFHEAERFIDAITNRPERINRSETINRELKSKVATWMLEMKLPSVFTRSTNRKHAILFPGEKLEDFVFISPDELSVLLKDRTAFSQLRDYIHKLAALDPTKAQVQNYLELERRSLEKRLKIADITFGVVDLLLLPVPAPFSTLASLTVKGIKKFICWSLQNPYRWMLFTEKINVKIETSE